ncbi:MAG TPA: class I SAM-dependent methyltransferase [Anaerolineales bacterium]|nr:class I SAM-dependent methyltransferase [Anaerolineales bacterium]
MLASLPPKTESRRLRFLEVGAGIGTMIERLLEGSVLGQDGYIALESEGAHRELAAQRLRARAEAHGDSWSRLGDDRWRLEGPSLGVEVEWRSASLFEAALSLPPIDVVLAHAFLDLVDLDRALPRLLAWLRPGGLFYFTLNFDGLTAFLPEIDADLDAAVVREYHASMDARRDGEHPSGDRRTGRRLLTELRRRGSTLLAAGSSDWIVLPHDGAYPGDEAFVLHTLLDMVESSVRRRAAIDSRRLSEWIEARRRQVGAGDLVFLAHQIDVVGRAPG